MHPHRASLSTGRPHSSEAESKRNQNAADVLLLRELRSLIGSRRLRRGITRRPREPEVALEVGEEEEDEEDKAEKRQFRLYMREVRRTNARLENGCLVVDGLYELARSRLPLDVRTEERPATDGVRELLSAHSSSGNLLLSKYWLRPDNPAEHGHYLAIASSFAEFVFSAFGQGGVRQLLRRLDCSLQNPEVGGFQFRGLDMPALEFKWKKFVEARVNKEFRLTTLGLLRELLVRHLAAHWLQLAAIALLVLLEVGMRVTLAIILTKLFAIGFYGGELETIFMWTGVQLGILLLHFALMQLSITLQASVAVRVSNGLRQQISTRLGSVTVQFFSDHSAGSLLSSFVEDVNAVEVLLSHGLRTLLFGTVMLAALLLFALVVAWPVGIPLAFLFIGGQVLLNIMASRLSNHSFARSQAINKLSDVLKEQIDGYAVNKLYGLGPFWQQRMRDALQSQYAPKARRSIFLTQFIFLVQFMTPVGMATLLTMGLVLLAQHDRLNFELGLPLITFFHSVMMAVTAASALLPLLQGAATAMGHINALLHGTVHTTVATPRSQGSPDEGPEPQSLPIVFERVSFSHRPTAGHWNIHNVSLSIAAGERVAVVGESGAGKSTFLGLVLGSISPVQGRLTIGPTEVGRARKRVVAATFQNNHIFNLSIMENIRIGRLSATDEEVKEAAEMADIHGWISTLPRGYNTVLQSCGSSLSGGQRQRIAIARMLVASSPVLVLDEVTSTLDPATETRVFDRLMEVTTGKTVISVTHHLSQVPHFDRVVVLSHGCVVEVGTHDELLAKGGTYWRLWNNLPPLSSGVGVPIVRRRSSLSSLVLPPDFLARVADTAAAGGNLQLVEEGQESQLSAEISRLINSAEVSRLVNSADVSRLVNAEISRLVNSTEVSRLVNAEISRMFDTAEISRLFDCADASCPVNSSEVGCLADSHISEVGQSSTPLPPTRVMWTASGDVPFPLLVLPLPLAASPSGARSVPGEIPLPVAASPSGARSAPGEIPLPLAASPSVAHSTPGKIPLPLATSSSVAHLAPWKIPLPPSPLTLGGPLQGRSSGRGSGRGSSSVASEHHRHPPPPPPHRHTTTAVVYHDNMAADRLI